VMVGQEIGKDARPSDQEGGVASAVRRAASGSARQIFVTRARRESLRAFAAMLILWLRCRPAAQPIISSRFVRLLWFVHFRHTDPETEPL